MIASNTSLNTQTVDEAGGRFLPYTVETLSDQRKVLIRPMNPGDADAEREFITALSPQSRRYRFQEQIREPSEEMIAKLVDVDHINDEAFVQAALREVGPTVEAFATAEHLPGHRAAITVRTAEPPSGRHSTSI